MKSIKAILLIGLFAYILSGCTYWTMSSDESKRLESSNETIKKNEYIYSEDVSAYKQIHLKLNIDVSGIVIKKASNHDFTLTQHANVKEIFVIPETHVSGDTLELTFNSPKKQNIFNSLNSDIVIELPEDILYSIESTVDVGEFNISSSDLEFTAIQATTDVGDIRVELNSAQPSLKALALKSDVGKVNLDLSGNSDVLRDISLISDVGDLSADISADFPALEKMIISGDTSRVNLKMDGQYGHAFSIEASSDIGEVNVVLNGDYTEGSNIKCTSSTGGVQLKIDDEIGVKLVAKKKEFVSDLKLRNINYTIQDEMYYLNDANESNFKIEIEAKSEIGDIEISN